MSESLLTVLAIVLAPFLGSFFCLLADRLPEGGSVVASRSICLSCQRPLGPRELVPIASYLLQRGRCRSCGSLIGRRTLLFELACLALAVQAALATSGWLTLAGALLGAALLAIALIDMEHFIVPDVLSLPLVLAGVGLAAAIPGLDLFAHTAGALAGFALFAATAFVYRLTRGREGLGLGDAKLFAAAGAWIGWAGLPFVLLIASFSGLAAVLVLRLRGRAMAATDALPFGPFLALGFWLVWLYGPFF